MLETRFSLLFQQKLETSLHRLKRIKEEKKNALQLSTLMEPIANSPAESLTCTIFFVFVSLLLYRPDCIKSCSCCFMATAGGLSWR